MVPGHTEHLEREMGAIYAKSLWPEVHTVKVHLHCGQLELYPETKFYIYLFQRLECTTLHKFPLSFCDKHFLFHNLRKEYIQQTRTDLFTQHRQSKPVWSIYLMSTQNLHPKLRQMLNNGAMWCKSAATKLKLGQIIVHAQSTII